MNDNVVQITTKVNEIQYYSCKQNSVVQKEEIFLAVHLGEVFSIPSISRHVIKDKQNIQHGSLSSRLSPPVEPGCTRHKPDGQESVVFALMELEIIFEIIESRDNMITKVNSHFAFQGSPVCNPQVEQFHCSRNIFEHIGTSTITSVMIYFLVGLLFTLVYNVAEPFKRMCWSIFKIFPRLYCSYDQSVLSQRTILG